MTGRRMLSIWWPNLAIERWAKVSGGEPDSPVVLTVEGTHGPIIHAVTKAAGECGARAGVRLADARVVEPRLAALPADPEGDSALVERLARWAGRWSPLVAVDGTGLLLDVTGVDHLFGGEEGLVADIDRRFGALGLTSRIGVAPTAAAARALARYETISPRGRGRLGGAERGEGAWTKRAAPSPSRRFAARKGERDLADRLCPLPVAALQLDPDTTLTLQRLGLKTIGALEALPRITLAKRFKTEALVDALDMLFGRKAEPLIAAPDDMPPRATLRLQEPATYPEAASQALDRLIPSLVEELEQRRLGVRRLTLTGFRVDGSLVVADVATSIPSREPKHLQRLLAEKAATLDPGFGFDGFALEAAWTEPVGAAQTSLIEEPSAASDVARLVDRLTVKLGPRAVRRPEAHESHLPERASGWVAAVHNPSPARGEGQMRPHRLLDRPEAIAVIYATPEGMPRRFVWRRAVHDIARVEGPERIAPEWWRQASTARLRDYYRVEDQAGRRYWIYRDGIAGDGRGGAPAWFIHGLFG